MFTTAQQRYDDSIRALGVASSPQEFETRLRAAIDLGGRLSTKNRTRAGKYLWTALAAEENCNLLPLDTPITAATPSEKIPNTYDGVVRYAHKELRLHDILQAKAKVSQLLPKELQYSAVKQAEATITGFSNYHSGSVSVASLKGNIVKEVVKMEKFVLDLFPKLEGTSKKVADPPIIGHLRGKIIHSSQSAGIVDQDSLAFYKRSPATGKWERSARVQKPGDTSWQGRYSDKKFTRPVKYFWLSGSDNPPELGWVGGPPRTDADTSCVQEIPRGAGAGSQQVGDEEKKDSQRGVDSKQYYVSPAAARKQWYKDPRAYLNLIRPTPKLYDDKGDLVMPMQTRPVRKDGSRGRR